MSSYTRFMTLVAAGAVLAGAGRAAAQSVPTEPNPYAPISAVSLAESRNDPGDSMGLLQNEMTQRGWGGDFLNRYGLKLTGYVQGGYSTNFVTPPDDSNGWGWVFVDEAEDFLTNQLNLKLTREIPFSADKFEMGFTVEMIYGSDGRFTQANGTNFYGDNWANERDLTFFPPPNGNVVQNRGFPGQSNPKNQVDFVQANLTINAPWANGVMFTVGKMVAPFGFETIDATTTPFYTHSYIFGLSQPRTITGVTAAYQYDQNWSVMGGIIVGWDQAFEDNNDFPSFILQGAYQSPEDWTIVATTVFGPEQDDEDGNWRFLLDLTAEWRWNVFDFGAECVFGWEPEISTPLQRFPVGPGQFADFQVFEAGDAWWFGAATYAGLYLDSSKVWYIQGRLEYFNDNDGARLLSSSVVAATLGLVIRPFPNDPIGKNLFFRPEVRADCATDQIFDGNNKETQVTLSCDVVFQW